MYTENGGIFVCKARHLQLAGGNKNNMNNMPIGMFGSGLMSPRIHSPMHPSSGRGGGRGGQSPRGGGRGGFGRGGISRDREILGKSIKITGGPYKGAVGIVKDATEATARVELHSSCQTISVDRNHIAVVGTGAKDGSVSTYGRTPGRTPASIHGAQTPIYTGSKTPLHGSATPQYEHGSRTPYGGMTPSHDGSMTPRHGAWDPSSNTPARSNDFDFNMDEANPSPNYTPSTPGYQNTPFPPQTPGSSHMYSSDYSPYQPSSSSPSPSPYGSGYMGTPSPTGYSPAGPQTPGAGLDSQISDWCTTDIEVKIQHDNTGLAGQTGIVRTVNSNVCSVFLPDEDRVVTVAANNLEPVPPRPKDFFKVITGDHREQVGTVLQISGANEVVVRLTVSGDHLMMPLNTLCKMKPD